MLAGHKAPPDALTAATVTVAWIIFANKPIYPLYVWWLTGEGVAWSTLTMLAAPFFLAVALLARHFPLEARIALPVIGLIDTVFETKLFGQASGTELFLAPCIMLVAMSFHAHEKNWQRVLAALFFVVFMVERSFIGAPIHVWSDGALETLFSLNAVAVASLMAFIAYRYAGVVREGLR